MGQRMEAPDRIESAANGPATPEPAPDVSSHEPFAKGQQALPNGDSIRQIDPNGNPVPLADPTAVADASAAKATADPAGKMPAVTDENIRNGQAANTRRSQELARERQQLEARQKAFDTERQDFRLQNQPAQEPGRVPLLSERLIAESPGVAEGMTPESMAVLNHIGALTQQQVAPMEDQIKALNEQVETMGQQMQVAREQRQLEQATTEGQQLIAAYGNAFVQQQMEGIQREMRAAPGLSLTKAFQLTAAPQLQAMAAKVAVQKAAEDNQLQQGASVLEGGGSPSVPSIPPAPPGETMRETAVRLGHMNP